MKKIQKRIIIKRRGHKEHYDEKKVYASVYAASINAEHSEKKSEKLALDVMHKIGRWIKQQAKMKTPIFSADIKYQISSLIKDREVALLYKHHLDIC